MRKYTVDNEVLKKRVTFYLTLLAAIIAAILSVLGSSCTSSKGLTLSADSIRTLNVHYMDSTSVVWPKK